MLTIRPDSTNDSPAGEPSPEAAVPGASPQAEEPKKPIPLIWVPATLGLGLLIATVYLGGRILTAKSHASAAARQTMAAPQAPRVAPIVPKEPVKAEPPKPVLQAKVVPAAAPQAKPVPAAQPVVQAKVETKPVAAVKPVAEAKPIPPVKPVANAASDDATDLPLITPQTGKRYIQIGALGPRATRRYLGELRRTKLEPHAAPGPSPDLIRVLVGPFRDKDSLSAVQAQLEAAGIQNFIRQY